MLAVKVSKSYLMYSSNLEKLNIHVSYTDNTKMLLISLQLAIAETFAFIILTSSLVLSLKTHSFHKIGPFLHSFHKLTFNSYVVIIHQ